MLIFNFTTKSPKILEGISKFILIVEDFNKNNRLLTSMKPLPLEFFKSVAFFLGHKMREYCIPLTKVSCGENQKKSKLLFMHSFCYP